MANGNNNLWLKILTGVLAIVGILIGVIYASAMGDVEQNTQDIKTVQVQTVAYDRATVEALAVLTERMKHMQDDITEIKDKLE